jgi:hypothetical protein
MPLSTTPIEGYWKINQYHDGNSWIDVSKYNYYVDFESQGIYRSYCFTWYYTGSWTIKGMDITCEPNDGLGSIYYQIDSIGKNKAVLEMFCYEDKSDMVKLRVLR